MLNPSPAITIREYRPEDQPLFRALNEAWISKFFILDQVDIDLLSDPGQYIIDPGGKIFMADYAGIPAGTCGLMRTAETTYEFTKMAVDEAFRGKGIGKALALHAIQAAQMAGATRIELYTQKVLPEAIGLYRKLGFREIIPDRYKYSRADTYMVLDTPYLPVNS